MQVHNTLGNGFQEVIYQRALALELRHIGLSFEREKEMPIHYRDQQIGTRRVDFFVANSVMVELKAVEKLENVHKAQAINYCEAYNIPEDYSKRRCRWKKRVKQEWTAHKFRRIVAGI